MRPQSATMGGSPGRGANAVLGATRGRASIVSKRQASTVMANATRQTMRAWSDALSLPAKPGKRRK